jgi:hypothetical protein
MMDWQEEKAMMQRQLQHLSGDLNRARKARDLAMEAARSAKLQYKSAQGGLERCKIDAGRYQWLRGYGVRFPGSGDSYMHGVEADRTIDQYMKMDAYGPTETELRADPSLTRRRWRDPLNPVLDPETAALLTRAVSAEGHSETR